MREMTVNLQGDAASPNANDSPQARPTPLTAAPNDIKLSGEPGRAKRATRVRCSDLLGDAIT